MIRHLIQEPNFLSVFWEARPSSGFPAELNILLTVFLAPMDPTQPYDVGRWSPPPVPRWLSPRMIHLLSTPKLNLLFHTHLADSPQQVRRGKVRDYDNTPFSARSWMRREFEEYKTKFKQVVELSWNNQIILIPPEDSKDGLSDDDYVSLVPGNPQIPAHVVCTLTLQFVQYQDNANAQIQVVRLDRDEARFAGRRADLMPLPDQGEFRSYMLLLTNEDVHRRDTTSYRWPHIWMSQIGAAHEIGHWLGRPLPGDDPDRFFPHIDADKYPKTNPEYDELQYGGAAGHRLGLMGGGSLVTPYEAGPWLTRARRHTKALFGWKFVHRTKFVGFVPVSDRQKKLTGRK